VAQLLLNSVQTANSAQRLRNKKYLPETSMKAAVLHAFDEKLTAKEFVKYEDVTDPKISRPMDVVVRIGGAGVCRTDLHIVEGIWRSKVDVKLPTSMGTRTRAGSRPSDPGRRHQGWRQRHLSSAGDQRSLPGLPAAANDMHALDSSFPGINANGGYAQYLLTGQALADQIAQVARAERRRPLYRRWADRLSRRQKGLAPMLLPGEYLVAAR